MNADHLMYINTYNPEPNILYYKKDSDMLQRDSDQFFQLKDQTYLFKQLIE